MAPALQQSTAFTLSTDMWYQLPLLFALPALALSESGNAGWWWMKRMLGGLKWRLGRVLSLGFLSNFPFGYPVLAGNGEQGATTAPASTTMTA